MVTDRQTDTQTNAGKNIWRYTNVYIIIIIILPRFREKNYDGDENYHIQVKIKKKCYPKLVIKHYWVYFTVLTYHILSCRQLVIM